MFEVRQHREGRFVVAREYRSPLRAERALETRARVYAAAAPLFAGQGYAATSVRQLAAAAGVSLDTLYSAGGKSGVFVGALRFSMSGQLDGARLLDTSPAATVMEGDDLGTILRQLAHLLTARHQRSVGLWAALLEGATMDADLAATRVLRDTEMRQQVAEVIDVLVGRGLVHAEYRSARTADLCWAAAHPNQFALLVGTAGWTPEAYQSWLAETCCTLLMPR